MSLVLVRIRKIGIFRIVLKLTRRMAPQTHFLPEDCVRLDGTRFLVDPRCLNSTNLVTEPAEVELNSPLGVSLVVGGVVVACGVLVTGKKWF